MNEVVATVEKQLLQAKGMSLSDIERSIGVLLGREIDYGEVFIQSTRGESFGLEDGIVKDGSFGVEAGIGVRALAGEKTGFAYSEDIRLDGLREAARDHGEPQGQFIFRSPFLCDGLLEVQFQIERRVVHGAVKPCRRGVEVVLDAVGEFV